MLIHRWSWPDNRLKVIAPILGLRYALDLLNAGVAVDHRAGAVFGLLHNLGVISPVPFSDGDE